MKEIKEMKEFLKKYNLLPVFEVVTEGQRAKQPKVKWTEKENRIFDPEKLTKVGYGLPCGKDTGVMVLDIDGDLTMLDKLCEAAGVEKEEIGKTLWVETANGGLHIYFKYREGLNNKTRFFGTCDFKTDGGYVIAPLSFLENKQKKMAQYKPLNYNPIQIIPEKLYNFIKNPQKASYKGLEGGNEVRLEDIEDREDREIKAFDYEKEKEKMRGMREGDGRNVKLNWILYHWAMQEHITEREEILKEAMKINESFKDELDQKEMEKIVNSVYKGVKEKHESVYYNRKGVPISNFIIKPLKYIVCEDNPMFDILEAEVVTNKGAKVRRLYRPNDFDEVRKFNAVTNFLAAKFLGTQKNLQDIKAELYEQVPLILKGILSNGLHKKEGEWVFVDEEGALRSDGTIRKDLVQIPQEGIRSKILEVDPITSEELQTIAPFLLEFNSIEIAASIMGYVGAIFLKERLKQEFNIKFPHLLISGEAGAGKSETVENIIMPMLSYASDKQTANGITTYTAERKISSSNTLPFIINEYKPTQMPQYKVDLISYLLRVAYEDETSIRGRKDLTMQTLKLTAPIILIGELSTTETAVIERSLILTLSIVDSEPHFFEFSNLVSSGVLPQLGRSLLEQALKIEKSELEDLIKEIDKKIEELEKLTRTREEEMIARKTSPRVLNTVRVAALGLYMIKRVFEEKGLNFEMETVYTISDLIKKVYDNVIKENLGGYAKTKTMVGTTLETISKALGRLEIDDNLPMLVLPYKREDKVLLRTSEIFIEAYKFIKNYGIKKTEIMDEKDFKKQVVKTFYCDGEKVRKYTENGEKKSFRGIVIDLQKAEMEGIEVDGIRQFIERLGIRSYLPQAEEVETD
jgi:hypothetical protein